MKNKQMTRDKYFLFSHGLNQICPGPIEQKAEKKKENTPVPWSPEQTKELVYFLNI